MPLHFNESEMYYKTCTIFCRADSLHCLMHLSPPPEAVLGGESESLDGSEISELINSRHLKRFSSS
jgi:hypothetical protein